MMRKRLRSLWALLAAAAVVSLGVAVAGPMFPRCGDTPGFCSNPPEWVVGGGHDF